MKRVWIIVLVMLIGFTFAMAQDIHWANQATVEWDCPTTTEDGLPIPSEVTLGTRVFLRNQDGSNVQVIDEVPSVVGATEQYTVTIPTGIYELGVIAVIYHPGSSVGLLSNFLWSGDAASPFFLGNAAAPDAHNDIRIVP